LGGGKRLRHKKEKKVCKIQEQGVARTSSSQGGEEKEAALAMRSPARGKNVAPVLLPKKEATPLRARKYVTVRAGLRRRELLRNQLLN